MEILISLPVIWLIFGIFLLIVEGMSFTSIALWPGIGALAASALGWLSPNASLAWQIGVFSIFSLISVYTLFRWDNKRQSEQRQSQQVGSLRLNRRGEELIGQTVTLDKTMEQGACWITIHGENWKLYAEDNLQKGTEVRLIKWLPNGFRVVPHHLDQKE